MARPARTGRIPQPLGIDMLDIIFLICFSVMTYRILKALKQEDAIFAEFKLPRTLNMTVSLLPLGPISMLFLIGSSPLLALIAGLACYLPNFFTARKISQTLEYAGTDRVHGARAVVSQAFGTALVGLIYTIGVFLFVVLIRVYFNHDAA